MDRNNQIYRRIHKPKPNNMERRLQATFPKEQVVDTVLTNNPSTVYDLTCFYDR